MSYGSKTRMAAAAILAYRVAPQATAGTPAPHDLYGMSVVITWTDTRTTEKQMEGNPRVTISIAHNASIYISSVGRIFSRYSVSVAGGSSKTWEQVGSDAQRRGQASDAATSTFQDIHFEGNALIGLQKASGSAFRRLEVMFGDGATSCAVRMTYPHQVGKERNAPYRDWNGVLQKIVEIHASTPECSVKQGNVFQ